MFWGIQYKNLDLVLCFEFFRSHPFFVWGEQGICWVWGYGGRVYVGRGWYEFGFVWLGILPNLWPLLYFGVVVLVILVTGVKQSQLLIPRLTSGFWTGVCQNYIFWIKIQTIGWTNRWTDHKLDEKMHCRCTKDAL